MHSAKGQEWETVHVLNVTDGSFPSEFSTGRAELIEEERRLLYVAMTRARSELRLMAPVRFYVTQQRGMGDRYVHGARSRFFTEPVLAQFDRISAHGERSRHAARQQGNRRAHASTWRAVCATCGRPPHIEDVQTPIPQRQRQKRKAAASRPRPFSGLVAGRTRGWRLRVSLERSYQRR